MILRRLRRARWGLIGATALVAACAAALLPDAPHAAAAVTKGPKPNIVLGAGKTTFHQDYTSLLVNDATPQADPSVVPTPDQCRDLPPLDVVCDVYRIKVNRDRSAGALNFVMLSVAWDRQATTPDLALVAVGLGASDLPDIDLFLYATPDTYFDYTEVGGRGATIPERLAFTAVQDEYDLVVRAGTGVVTNYSITARWSNELFGKPFELLDDLSNNATNAPVDLSGDTPAPGVGLVPPTSPLALAPVAIDDAIAGIGLGATEQFDVDDLALGNRTRAIAATSEPPSTLVLVLAMFFFPLAAALGAVFVLRRRRDAYTA